jgi:hypothetical protein
LQGAAVVRNSPLVEDLQAVRSSRYFETKPAPPRWNLVGAPALAISLEDGGHVGRAAWAEAAIVLGVQERTCMICVHA